LPGQEPFDPSAELVPSLSRGSGQAAPHATALDKQRDKLFVMVSLARPAYLRGVEPFFTAFIITTGLKANVVAHL